QSLPVATPRVSSRLEAWQAWESSLLHNRLRRDRPKTNFWKRWEKIRADLFIIDDYKQHRGDVTFTTRSGRVITVNILEGKQAKFNSDYLLRYDARIDPRHKDLEESYEVYRRYYQWFRRGKK